jgi:hypothetical protein
VTTPDLQLLRPAPEMPDDLLRVMAAPGPAGPGGMFFVDPERAQQCIDTLRGCVVQLRDTARQLDQAYFPPPAEDPVSVNLAVQGRVMADRAHAYVTAWRLQLEQTVEGLQQQLATYLTTDDDTRSRLT